jgi:hypothetical protein
LKEILYNSTHMDTTPECSIEQTLKVMGTFDPSSLLISLNAIGYLPSVIEPSQDVLEHVDINTLAHETCHFFQTTSTLSGVRNFTMWFDYLNAKIDFIKEISRSNNNILSFPIYPKLLAEKRKNVYVNIAWYYLSCIIAKRLQFYGGYSYKEDQVRDLEPIIHGLVYKTKFIKVLGLKHALPVLLINPKLFNGKKEYFIFGLKHIREGAAKSLDIIRGKINNEQILEERATESSRTIWDPYLVTNSIFGVLLNQFPENRIKAQLECLYLLSDLTMLYDFQVMNWSEVKKYKYDKGFNKTREIHNLLYDISPGESFFNLVYNFFSQGKYKLIEEFSSDWEQEGINNFQENISDLIGVSIKDCLHKSITFFIEAFSKNKEIVSGSMLKFYKEMFTDVLNYRLNIGGGAILSDLLTKDEKLKQFFYDTVPAFQINHAVISRTSFKEGVGIGVNFEEIAQYQRITDSMIFGNETCNLHLETPRSCVVEPNILCYKLVQTNNKIGCIREQILSNLLSQVKCTNVN